MDLHPNVPIALAILRDTHNKHVSSNEEIAKMLHELTEAGVKMHELYLRREPGNKFSSESVGFFVGHMADAEWAERFKHGKFCFSDQGLQICIDNVYEEVKTNPERLKNILTAMNYDAFDLLAAIAEVPEREPRPVRT